MPTPPRSSARSSLGPCCGRGNYYHDYNSEFGSDEYGNGYGHGNIWSGNIVAYDDYDFERDEHVYSPFDDNYIYSY